MNKFNGLEFLKLGIGKFNLKRLGLFALFLPFSKFAPAHAAAASTAPGVLRARDLQCDQAQTLVEREGVVTLATNLRPDGDVYAYDSDDCDGARAERAFIATSDSPACMVGFHCDSN